VHRGETTGRDGLKDTQARIEAGEAEGLAFCKLDHVGRSQIHLARLVQWAKNKGLMLLSADEGFMVQRRELKNEALLFLIALAQVERERISRRTKEGLAAARAKSIRLGRPPEQPQNLDRRATELRRQGLTFQEIADRFNAEGLKTARGKAFQTATIYYMVNRTDPAANPVGGYRGKEPATVA